jgi:PAS domain S-box-containing protein
MQAEQRFRALVQNGSDLIVVIDQKGTFHYVSDNVKTVLGYAPEEMLGQCALELIHPEDAQKVATNLDALLGDKACAKAVAFLLFSGIR